MRKDYKVSKRRNRNLAREQRACLQWGQEVCGQGGDETHKEGASKQQRVEDPKLMGLTHLGKKKVQVRKADWTSTSFEL